MKKVLIFWEELPVDSSCGLILNVNEDEFRKLNSFHNHYINFCGTKEYESITDKMKKFFFNDEKLKSFKFEHDRISGVIQGNFDAIIRCGVIW